VSADSTPQITWNGQDFAVAIEIVKLGEMKTSVQVPAVDDPWLRRFIAALVAFERIEGANRIAPAHVLEMAGCRWVEKGSCAESWSTYETELGVTKSTTRQPRSRMQPFLRWSRGGQPDRDGRLARLSGAFDAWLALPKEIRPNPAPHNGEPGTSELAEWLRREGGYQDVAKAHNARLEYEAALKRGSIWVTHANGTERVYDSKAAADSDKEGPVYEEPAEWWDLEGCELVGPGECRRIDPETNDEDGHDPLPERINGVVRPEHHGPADQRNYSESEFKNATAKRHYPLEYATHNRKYASGLPPASEEWYAPPQLFQATGCTFDLDPASPGADFVPWIPAKRHFTRSDNGLEQDWGDDFVWLNAPYTKEIFPLWLEKCRQHANGVCLTVDRTSARWWQELCSNADLILQVNKKVRFLRPPDEPTYSSPALGHTLVAYGPRGVEALINAARNGLGALLVPYGKLAAKENDIAELKGRIAALEGENSTLKARGTDRDNATPPERS
jgi:DNA N-6-adenine-methyltransferase (Dam)